ncbi:hypothetical protein RCL1_001723 [Eukaryota sp. TZLM3-RCL]
MPAQFSTPVRDATALVILLVIFWFSLSKKVDVSPSLEFSLRAFPPKIDKPISSRFPNPYHTPPPIISNLGKKRNLVLVPTTIPSIDIYDLTVKRQLTTRTQRSRVLSPRPLHSIPLIPSSGTPSLPVALSTGRLTDPKLPQNLTHQPLEGEIIVAVLEDLTILAFDSSFNKLWENHLYHDVSEALHDLTSFEISITIVPQRLLVGDEGSVIVGVRPKRRTHQDNNDHFSPFDDELLPHMDYFAFNGKTGEERWCHVGNDDVSTIFHTSEAFFVDDRMSSSSISHSHHKGENDWRVFRSSVLNVLPFRWTNPLDSKISSQFFVTDEKLSQEAVQNPRINPHKIADQSYSPFLSLQQQRQIYTVKMLKEQFKMDQLYDNVVVGLWGNGIEILHLYAGKVLSHLRLMTGATYADVNDDGLIEKIEVRYSPTDHKVPLIFAPKCQAVVTSLSARQDILWEASICHLHDDLIEKVVEKAPKSTFSSGIGTGSRKVKGKKPQSNVESPPNSPIIDAAVPFVDKETKRIIFLTSNGLLTAYSFNGYLEWQSHNGATWEVQTHNNYLSETPQLPATISKVKISNKKFGYLTVSPTSVHISSTEGEHLLGLFVSDGPLVSSVVTGDVTNSGVTSLIVPVSNSLRVYTLRIYKPSSAMVRTVVAVVALAALALYASVQTALRQKDLGDLLGEKSEERTL